jgi:hypothetical protein
MKADDAKGLNELERENVRLKRIVADQPLNIDALRRSKLLSPSKRRRALAMCRHRSRCRNDERADWWAAPIHRAAAAARCGYPSSADQGRARTRARDPAVKGSTDAPERHIGIVRSAAGYAPR